jgi:Domain of unknown function (DUF4845)
MTVAYHRARRHQRGITLMGLLFWGGVLGFGAVVGMKVLPTINEFMTIQRSVDKIAKEGGSTVPEIRTAFDRQKEVEYGITSIGAKDLNITKENDKIVVSFAYPKEVELFGNVSLLIKYQGRSK